MPFLTGWWKRSSRPRRQAKGSGSYRIEVGPGELINRVTVLQIKSANLSDPAKLPQLRSELAALEVLADRALRTSQDLQAIAGELRSVNEPLWKVEDEIRVCERARDFGCTFIALARSVYQLNDRRSALKRRINELTGSMITEEKIYANCNTLSGHPVCIAAQCFPESQTTSDKGAS